MQEITHGHSQLYNAGNQKVLSEKKNKIARRRTFITFSIESVYAVQITEIKEIIDYPKNILQLPGLPPYCKGMVNLRGEMVTIVDAREMYSCEKKAEGSPGKVLVFKKETLHFGLIVDSVEAIVSFSDDEKIKIPDMLYKDSGGLANDVTEALQYKNVNNEDKSILILNSNAIAARVLQAA